MGSKQSSCPNSSLYTIIPYTWDRALGESVSPQCLSTAPWDDAPGLSSHLQSLSSRLIDFTQPSLLEGRNEQTADPLPQQGDGTHRDWHPGFDGGQKKKAPLSERGSHSWLRLGQWMKPHMCQMRGAESPQAKVNTLCPDPQVLPQPWPMEGMSSLSWAGRRDRGPGEVLRKYSLLTAMSVA